MTDNWNFPKVGIPTKHGEHYYFGYNSGMMPQTQYYRIKEKNSYVTDMKNPLANAELYLDPNAMYADGKTEMGSGTWSEDGKYMAYSETKGGSDWKTYYIHDVAAGKKLDDELMWIKFSGASWSKDSQGFFYSRYEPPKSYGKDAKKGDVSGK
jgi:prolyl oligopeptidase